MKIQITTDVTMNLTPPETATPIDTVLGYSIEVAGVILDVRAIYDQFKQSEKSTRQDVKDFIETSKQKISGLEHLEKAILGKTKDVLRAKRIVGDAYDEIIDKMVAAEWLSFHAELSPEFEMQLVEQWADTVA